MYTLHRVLTFGKMVNRGRGASFGQIVMAIKGAEASPRSMARIAGVLYLLVILTSAFAEVFVRGRIIIRTDAAMTAANILAHESLYRLGGAADLINFACYLAVTALFYRLFKSVNTSLSLVAVFFSLLGCASGAVMCLFHFAPLSISGDATSLSAFNPQQLQAFSLILLQLQARMYSMSVVFFGGYCFLIGCLVFRSTFIPRILGALMVVAGLCYLIAMFARFVTPVFAAHLFPYILLLGALGEYALTLWLILVGLNVERWQAVAAASSEQSLCLCRSSR